MIENAMRAQTAVAGQTLGVIDIGSNSGRVMVARVLGAAHLDVLGDARSPLRLVRDVATDGRLSAATIERTLRIVRGFVAVASSAGAERTVAVATAAVREASNGDEFIERVRTELGILSISPDGAEEARYGFYGAVHGLPVEHGIVLDVGGGSLQLVHFRGRRLLKSWSLPLGALRLNDKFLQSDPPSRGEMRSLKEHVYATLEDAGISSLQADERLVVTGGTVRNLAKVDRRLRGEYPISRLHGYILDRRRLDDAGLLLARELAGDRARVPGLNSDRSDSIVGGALVIQAVMDRLLASELTVAGYGLRGDQRCARYPTRRRWWTTSARVAGFGGGTLQFVGPPPRGMSGGARRAAACDRRARAGSRSWPGGGVRGAAARYWRQHRLLPTPRPRRAHRV